MTEKVTLSLMAMSMRMEVAKAAIASTNIANVNVAGSKKVTIDFADVLSGLKSQDAEGMSQSLQKLSQTWDSETQQRLHVDATSAIEIDAEILNLMKASGRYKKMAEIMNRQLGLASLAAGGK